MKRTWSKMKIVGFSLSKLVAERQDKPIERVRISSNLSIKDITEEKDAPLDNVFSFVFVFNVDYGKLAKLEFTGKVLAQLERKEAKLLQKEWKNKNLPDEINLPLLNFILTKCNIKALVLADELGLPPAVPLPKVGKKPEQDNKKSNYVG